MSRKEIKLRQQKLNTDASGRKLPKSKRLVLTPSSEGIMVTREKKDLAPASVFLAGREYTRTYQFGNRSSEKLVRANLEKFVEGAQQAVKDGLSDGRLLIAGEGQLKNSIWDVEKICADIDGIDSRGFFDTKGRPMARNEAFRYAIRQFFKDEEFAKAVCMVAIWDHLTKSRQ